jgi:hypothetical protein
MANVFGGYGVKVNNTLIGGITQLGIPAGIEAKGDATSGQPSPGMMSLIQQKPAISFATKQLARALAVCGITGFACSTGAYLTLYAQRRLNEGGRSTSADSRIVTVKKGLLYPDKLSWSQGGDANLGYNCAVIWDGVNEPLIYSVGAVPGALVDDQAFALNAVVIGGVTIENVQSAEIDFGIRATTTGGNGEVWDSHVCIEECKPRIMVKTTDLSVHSSIGNALACTQGNTAISYRPRVQGGTFAGSGNVALTAAGMAHVQEPISASGTGNAEATVVLDVNFDGTNAILLFS